MASAEKANLVSAWVSALIVGLITVGASAQERNQGKSPEFDKSSELEEIVVTAQRREQALNEVPISISAFSQEQMDVQGVRRIEDVVRLTPGLRITQGYGENIGYRTNISIRGISSMVGSATTGIYINDTPIQVRSNGNVATNAYPYIFDLKRVEVLRGPQGTLFGAGAEGGAIRFITPDPGLSTYDAYSRADVAITRYGDPSYEGGVAVGGPIEPDVLGFRVSGSYRRAGGWVDRINIESGTVVDKNSNSDDTYTFRGALKWQVTPNFVIESSVFHQKQSFDDASQYFQNFSNPDDGKFNSGRVLSQPFDDKFTLPALDITWDGSTSLLGDFTVTSNTSYLDRKVTQVGDFTNGVSAILFGSPYPPVDPYVELANYKDTQKVWTQEIRIQSANEDSRVQWVAGGFFSKAKQSSLQVNTSPNIADAILAVYGITVEQAFGVPLYQGKYIFFTTRNSKDEQRAVFAQLDFELRDGITLTGGLRQSWTDFRYTRDANGPIAGGTSLTSGAQSESPVTYKAGLSWKVNGDNLLYASVSKGYRIGGANLPTSSFCNSELDALGITDTPSSYDSDSTVSYEVGSKNSLFDGALQIAASGFYIKWMDIQSSVPLAACGSEFVTNFGEATSKGFDLGFSVRPTSNLTFSGSAGYTNATLDKTLHGTGTIILGLKGDSVTSGPKWTATISGNYDFQIAGKDAFVRSDYQYQGKGQVRSPGVFGVDPGILPSEKVHALAFRAGIDIGHIEISAYVNNALDEAPRLSTSRDTPVSPLFYETTLRPRTFGITLTYR